MEQPLSNGKAIVFGASGYLGSHVAEQLRRAQRPVSAPQRSAGTPSAFLTGIGIAPQRLDFASDAALERSIAGHDIVYCCLANPRRHQPLAALRAVEVELTGRVIAAAGRAGARRVVLLSTVMVYGFGRPPQPIDEDWPPAPEHACNRVALERELAARAAAAAAGVELAILRPANALGRRDRQMARLFASFRHGFFPLFGNEEYRYSAIDARDVGRAMLFLGDLPQAAGHVWLAKGYDTSWRELKRTLERLTGRHAVALRLPRPFARGLGNLIERACPHAWEPALTRFSVDVMSTHTLFDTRKIEAAGFRPRYGLEDSVREYLPNDDCADDRAA